MAYRAVIVSALFNPVLQVSALLCLFSLGERHLFTIPSASMEGMHQTLTTRHQQDGVQEPGAAESADNWLDGNTKMPSDNLSFPEYMSQFCPKARF